MDDIHAEADIESAARLLNKIQQDLVDLLTGLSQSQLNDLEDGRLRLALVAVPGADQHGAR